MILAWENNLQQATLQRTLYCSSAAVSRDRPPPRLGEESLLPSTLCERCHLPPSERSLLPKSGDDYSQADLICRRKVQVVEAKLIGHHVNCYCLLHNQGNFWLILLNFCLVEGDFRN